MNDRVQEAIADVISQIPLLIILLVTIKSWDTEYWILVASFFGLKARQIYTNFLKGKEANG